MDKSVYELQLRMEAVDRTLNGCRNRLFVSRDVGELVIMRDSAIRAIETLFNLRKRILEGDDD